MTAPKLKLAVLSSHPIQYYAPVFRALAQAPAIEPRVFYTWSQTANQEVFDPGFAVVRQWDIPLLDGYAYEFLPNVSRDPGTHHFWGLRNPTLIQALENWRADALLVYGWNHWSHLRAMIHFKSRIPVFFRGDSTLLDAQSALRKRVRRVMLHWVYSHIDAAIAVGTNNREYFRWCGVPDECIHFAPHSIDAQRYAAGSTYEQQAATWRRQLGIADDALVFVFAGKLQPKKDPLLLLQSFGQLGDSGAHLVFVGSGELEAELRARAAAGAGAGAGAGARVHFMPFQNQSLMPAVYRVGDVFVLPSRGPGETWGLAINEAMASGRAVVASNKVGAVPDLIRPEVNGWIFEAANGASLTAALGKALQAGRSRLQQMGAAGRRMIDSWTSEAAALGIAAAIAARARLRS